MRILIKTLLLFVLLGIVANNPSSPDFFVQAFSGIVGIILVIY